MITNAYQMCLGIFKQDSAGTAYAKLPEEFAAIKWSLSSIIPVDYDFTNIQVGDTTIETIEKNTITALTKAKKYDSGAITPPTFTFNTLTGADVATIAKTLDDLTGLDDPFKVLLCVGIYDATASGVRSYDVFQTCAAILTADGGRSGEAKANLTGSVSLQALHLPIVGTTACAAKLSWTESSGAVAVSFNS